MQPTVSFTLGILLATSPIPAQPHPATHPATHPAGAQFRSLFDGHSLEGWTTRGGRYDGKAVWRVEDGAIVGREGPNHAGGLLYTKGYYRSFQLSLETWIDYPFDSGIFLNMVPRGVPANEGGGRGYQVTLDYRPNGEIGGIYADGWLMHNSTAKAAFRRGEWNRVDVRCTGTTPRIEVWLNGKKITDFEHTNPKGFAVEGRIGLQVHGNRNDPGKPRARFRNIRLRELPLFDRAVFRVDDQGQLHALGTSSFQRLFDGKSLAGWEPVGAKPEGFVTANGVLAFRRTGGGGYLRTTRDFRDFDLRLDFKIADMANSGVFLRAARDGSNPAYSGCEIQILDDHNWERVTKTKLKPYQFAGGLYGSVAAGKPGGRDALRPNGRWNTYRIRYRGSRIRVELNGHELYDVDTHKVPGKPFAKRAKRGFIGLQRHAPEQVHGEFYAWFRNIWLRPIHATASQPEGKKRRKL